MKASLHGIGISIEGDAVPERALAARLATFLSDASSSDLTFEYNRVHALEPSAVPHPSGSLRAVYNAKNGEVLYDEGADHLYLTLKDRIHLACDVTGGHTRVSVRQPCRDEWFLSHAALTLPLIEMLKRRGLYSLHAAGLSLHGRGLLLAGTSGSGKTTLTIALARAGFGFMTDDMVFLSSVGDALQVSAFPDEIDVTDATARMFPELRPVLAKPRRPGWPKRSFRMEATYHLQPVLTCTPAAVVIPHIAKSARSVLEPMGADDALLELVPNVLLTDRRASQQHLDVLARLATQTPCYALHVGRDVQAVPGLLGPLLGANAGSGELH